MLHVFRSEVLESPVSSSMARAGFAVAAEIRSPNAAPASRLQELGWLGSGVPLKAPNIGTGDKQPVKEGAALLKAPLRHSTRINTKLLVNGRPRCSAAPPQRATPFEVCLSSAGLAGGSSWRREGPGRQRLQCGQCGTFVIWPRVQSLLQRQALEPMLLLEPRKLGRFPIRSTLCAFERFCSKL